MRQKVVIDFTSRIPLLVVLLLFFTLIPFPISSIRVANAAPAPGTTAISPTDGTGSPVSLGTVITSAASPTLTVPTDLCTASCVVTGGTRDGNNLFHSFGDFSIGTLDSARFQTELLNPLPDTSITNILGRVTGGNPSNIFGSLNSATYYPSANLFLMNPAGFLFGQNATVNVGGMMTFTTANRMQLTDGGRFNANHNAIPADLLTAAPVAAFGFIGSDPAAIDFTGGHLTVTNGTGITLVGGDINLSPHLSEAPSSITAPGRQILLTSVDGQGEVAADTGVPTPDLPLGTITLGQDSILSTAGDSAFGGGSGGSISIRGGKLVATKSTIASSPTPLSTGVGGEVTIAVTGSATFTDSTIRTSPVFDFSFTGSAGPISVTANEGLTMTSTTIDTSAFFAGGDAGPVILNSTNGPISLTDSFISTNASAPGNGGRVTITGKDVTLTNSGITTDIDTGLSDLTIDPLDLGLFRPGAVTVKAQNTLTFSGSPFGDPFTPIISARATGTLLDAGSVTITGKTVNLSNGFIDVNMNQGQIPSPGSSGTIKILGNNINLSQFSLQSFNAGFPASTGNGGSIILQGHDNSLADDIQLTNLQIVAASVTGGGAGTIEFQTNALTLNNTRVSANSAGSGPGGSVAVHGAQTVTLQDNSVMSASAASTGNATQGPFGSAGSVLVETEQLTMQGGSALKAADLPTSKGNAGNITVRGTDGTAQSILIDGAGTGIFTDAEGNGAGGDINLFANTVTLQNGGTLSAKTSGAEATATGGSITVHATDHVTITDGSSITASSTGPGNAGDIKIDAGQTFVATNSENAVTTRADDASGGNITLIATDTVQLTNSRINASVADGSGGGGNISIDPQYVILQGSQILAQAAQGQGGAITITTNLFLPDAISIVSADSGSGVNGTVTIQSPNSPASGQIHPLGNQPLEAMALLNQRCAALAGGEFSSFTVAGRDTLPTEPGSWLASPLAMLSTKAEPRARSDEERSVTKSENSLLSLRHISPAGFLTQAFAGDWSSGCQS